MAEKLKEDMAGLQKNITDSLTDSMVERLGSLAEKLGAAVMPLADQQTSNAVSETLRTLADLNRTGALKNILALGEAASFVQNSLTDSAIERSVSAISSLGGILQILSKPGVAEGLNKLLSIAAPLIENGHLNNLLDFASSASAVVNMLTDSMLARTLDHAQNFLFLYAVMGDAVEHVRDKIHGSKPPSSLFKLLGKAKDKNTLKGVAFFLEIANYLGRAL